MEPIFCVMFSLTRAGERCLEFACQMARAAKAQLLLVVTNAQDADDADSYAKNKGMNCKVACVGRLADLQKPDQQFILVATQAQGAESEPSLPKMPYSCLLYSMGEDGLRKPGPRSILLSIGAGSSSLRAAKVGIPLAKAIESEIVLVHATWREPSLPEDALAEHHMRADAKNILDHIVAQAKNQSVKTRTIVGMPDSIPAFIAKTANDQDCCMVVLAVGRNVYAGGRIPQITRVCNVPVLVAI